MACLVLGGITVLPLMGIVGWLVYYQAFVRLLINDWLAPAADISPSLIVVDLSTTVLWGSVVLGLLLWVYYLAWVLRTNRLSRWAKAGWSLALCLAGLITMPVLWWRHFWRGC